MTSSRRQMKYPEDGILSTKNDDVDNCIQYVTLDKALYYKGKGHKGWKSIKQPNDCIKVKCLKLYHGYIREHSYS